MAKKVEAIDAFDMLKRAGVDLEETQKRARVIIEQIEAAQLVNLRKAAELTQTEMAKRLDLSQNRISQIELADFETLQVSTLRNYVEALDGELIIGAIIDGQIYSVQEAPPKRQ